MDPIRAFSFPLETYGEPSRRTLSSDSYLTVACGHTLVSAPFSPNTGYKRGAAPNEGALILPDGGGLQMIFPPLYAPPPLVPDDVLTYSVRFSIFLIFPLLSCRVPSFIRDFLYDVLCIRIRPRERPTTSFHWPSFFRPVEVVPRLPFLFSLLLLGPSFFEDLFFYLSPGHSLGAPHRSSPSSSRPFSLPAQAQVVL